MHRRRGFTLIELLVVIAVIALIAAILFPVLAQTREKARGAACLSNMRQIGSAIMMYLQDYDERLPYGYTFRRSGTELFWVQDLLRPYVKNEQVYTCPSRSPHLQWTTGRPHGLPNPLIKDYMVNAVVGAPTLGRTVNGFVWRGRPFWIQWPCQEEVCGPFDNDGFDDRPDIPPRSYASLAEPAGTIAVLDARHFEIWLLEQTDAWHDAGLGSAWFQLDPEQDPRFRTMGHVDKRHSEGFNATFCDGHVKWLRNSTLGMWTVRAND